MLLSRSLPPHFLLPAWGTRQLLRSLQRAHQSTRDGPEESGPTSSQLDDESHHAKKPLIRHFVSIKGSDISKREKSPTPRITAHQAQKHRNAGPDRVELRGLLMEDEPSYKGDRILPRSKARKGSISPVSFGRTEGTSESSSSGYGPDLYRIPSLRPTQVESPQRTELTNSFSSQDRAHKSSNSVEPRLQKAMNLTDNQTHKNPSNVPLEKTQISNPQSGNNDRAGKATSTLRLDWTKPTGSLFDQLFPEESKSVKQTEKKTVDKLPKFEWHDGPKIDWKETVEKAAKERKNLFYTVPVIKTNPPQIDAEVKTNKRDLAVLVLSSASKTLEESDFFRVGEKGEHIEGWTSGIVKVIQGRDSQTLAPLGHYFLVFSDQTAAKAYLDQTIRLHALSRTHSGWESPIPLPSRFLRPGEDVKTILRGFSLVPGQSKLSLRLISQHYSPAVAQVLSVGGLAAIARQKTNSEDMVLFSVDLGPITYWDVRNAISDDGKKRNLHWRLTEGEGAVVKVNGKDEDDESSEVSRYNRSDRRYLRAPPKFILSFQDSHEARRFVREWHRRPFPVQKEHTLGDEPPPTINAEMFW